VGRDFLRLGASVVSLAIVAGVKPRSTAPRHFAACDSSLWRQRVAAAAQKWRRHSAAEVRQVDAESLEQGLASNATHYLPGAASDCSRQTEFPQPNDGYDKPNLCATLPSAEAIAWIASLAICESVDHRLIRRSNAGSRMSLGETAPHSAPGPSTFPIFSGESPALSSLVPTRTLLFVPAQARSGTHVVPSEESCAHQPAIGGMAGQHKSLGRYSTSARNE
jgi:hypothetical protein